MTAKIGHSLTYVGTLLLGFWLGFLFAEPGKTKPAPEYRSLLESRRAPLLNSSSNGDASKRGLEDVPDQGADANLSVPISALKNMGFDGIDLSDGFLRIDDTLAGILRITDVEAAKLKEAFSSVLSRVRESQLRAAEVVSHDPEGTSVIKVAAFSKEQAQLWEEELHAASAEVLGNKRGGQFCDIIRRVLQHTLAYPSMTITVSPSSEYGDDYFQFKIESENGTSTSNSQSPPARIAHLVNLSDSQQR